MLLHFLIADMVHLEYYEINKNQCVYFINPQVEITIGRFSRILGIDVQILQYNGLAEGRLVVDPRTAISMSARSDLEVEGAVNSGTRNLAINL